MKLAHQEVINTLATTSSNRKCLSPKYGFLFFCVICLLSLGDKSKTIGNCFSHVLFGRTKSHLLFRGIFSRNLLLKAQDGFLGATRFSPVFPLSLSLCLPMLGAHRFTSTFGENTILPT